MELFTNLGYLRSPEPSGKMKMGDTSLLPFSEPVETIETFAPLAG